MSDFVRSTSGLILPAEPPKPPKPLFKPTRIGDLCVLHKIETSRVVVMTLGFDGKVEYHGYDKGEGGHWLARGDENAIAFLKGEPCEEYT